LSAAKSRARAAADAVLTREIAGTDPNKRNIDNADIIRYSLKTFLDY
jgi:hypothetical protein